MTMLKGPKKYAQNLREIVQDRACLKFSPKDTIPDMLERMHAQKVGAGGVIDASGKFIGLVTEREIVRKIFGNAQKLEERIDMLSDPKESKYLTAWDVMIAAPDTLHPDEGIEEAQDIITYFGYRYMPVVDHKERLHGLVDARELHQHVYAKSQDMMESKDTLLSYFIGREPYGIGASI